MRSRWCAGGLAALGLVLACGCSRPYRPMKVLMVVGGTSHDYVGLPIQLAARLTARGDMEVTVTDDLAGLTAESMKPYEVLVFNTCHRPPLSAEFKQAVLVHVRTGGGLVAVHCSLWSYVDWPEWSKLIGGFVERHDTFMEYEAVVLDPAHPVATGLGNRFSIADEPYLVDQRGSDLTVLVQTARVHQDPRGGTRAGPEPQAWIRHEGRGRVFVTTFGHDARAQESEAFMTLLHNGIRWAGKVIREPQHNQLTTSEAQAGFELAFAGDGLGQWAGSPAFRVSTEGGAELAGVSDGAAPQRLVYQRPLADFDLRFSVRLLGGRAQLLLVPANDPAAEPLARIGLGTGDWGVPAGATFGESASVAQAWTVTDGWNELVIGIRRGRLSTQVNGVDTAEAATLPAGAALCLAIELPAGAPAEAHFRDIRVRQLPDARSDLTSADRRPSR